MGSSVYDRLKKYCASDAYPFHMPGHKRRLMPDMGSPYAIDITEIDGFDNLHHAQGILKEAQERAAVLYGAEETYYLVNGSSGGILAAVSACTTANGKLLMARNCHKAVWHCAQIRGLHTEYLMPGGIGYKEGAADFWTARGVNGCIDPADVEAALKNDPEIEAVLITSPTYDGIVSDVAAIAQAAHRYGVPLIVDEAHGAHFGFHPYFPQNSVRLGADIVIHSLHKTLPSLTQTALLHVNGTLVEREKLREYLGIYQTSSPSYIFMAGMDWCIDLLSEESAPLFAAFAGRLERFYEETKELERIRVMAFPKERGQGGICRKDPSKILIGAQGQSGLWIGRMLRERFHLEPEMEAEGYALALTSAADTDEGFARLSAALRELDRDAAGMEKTEAEEIPVQRHGAWKPEQAFTIGEAKERQGETVPLRESAGRVSCEYCYLYPPGIPLLVPGERISEEILGRLLQYRKRGMSLQGLEDYTAESIRVCGTA